MTRTGSDSGAGFEEWLGHQLRVTLGAERGPRPRPAASRYAAASQGGGARLVAIRSSLLAALSLKALAGGAVVALAAGAAATVATGSANPVDWGQGVAQAVEQCKDQVRGEQASRSSGAHGIGQCVSDAARHHGQQRRDGGAANAEGPAGGTSPLPGNREGQGQGGPSRGGGNAAGAQGAGRSGGQQSAGSPGDVAQSSHGRGQGQGQPTPRSSPKG